MVDDGVLLPFVELEFTNGLGPAEGRYLVRPPDADPVARTAAAPGSGIGPTVPVGSADVLLIRVEGGAPASSRWAGRGRARRIEGAAAPAPVPLYRAALLLGTRAYPDRRAAAAELDGWRQRPQDAAPLVDAALAVLNRAVRAYRAAAADPYVVEVARGDARAVRVGYGGEPLSRGAWDDAVQLPDDRPRRAPRAERLRPVEIVADVLARRREVLDGEDVLLRAVLDIEQGRPRVAAAQLALAVALLRDAREGPGARLYGIDARVEALRRGLAGGQPEGASCEELNALAREVGEAIDAWRAG